MPTLQHLPSPPAWPVAGHAFSLAGDIGGFLARQYQLLGPVFAVRAFGRRFVVIAGPEANVFVTRRGTAHLRSQDFWLDFNAEFGAGRSLVGMDGTEHARLRSVMGRAYSRSFAHHRLDEVVAIARRRMAAWPVDAPVRVLEEMQAIVTEQLGVLLAGVSPVDQLSELTTFVRTLLAVRVTRQRPGLLLRLAPYRRARRAMFALARRVRRAHDVPDRSGRSRDLVDDLLALHAADPAFFPASDLRLAVFGPYIAGLDTAAATLAFLVHALLQDPMLLRGFQAEADALFAAGPLTPALLGRFDVGHRVVLETLRLFPVAPAIVRTVVNPFDFAGFTIPAGTRLIVATTASHHHPRYFPEPGRFDIDRFIPPRAEHRRSGVFAPYGAGAHVCLGAGFADVLILATAAALVHQLQAAPAFPGYRLQVRYVPSPHPDHRFALRVDHVRHAFP